MRYSIHYSWTQNVKFQFTVNYNHSVRNKKKYFVLTNTLPIIYKCVFGFLSNETCRYTHVKEMLRDKVMNYVVPRSDNHYEERERERDKMLCG